MNKRLQGFIAGILCCALFTGVSVLAKKMTDYIEVSYNNIKVYKDNVLCELKDANGGVIEPFIYNGTTYMPLRGTANLAGMEVEWDGMTQSVYLWDEIVPDGTYLMDVCPPYDVSMYCDEYYTGSVKSFSMAGEKYNNGLVFTGEGQNVLFNLNSKYSTIEFIVGHTAHEQKEKTLYFFLDGKLTKELTLEPECMPKKISIPVKYALQLKIMNEEDDNNNTLAGSGIGLGNITVK